MRTRIGIGIMLGALATTAITHTTGCGEMGDFIAAYRQTNATGTLATPTSQPATMDDHGHPAAQIGNAVANAARDPFVIAAAQQAPWGQTALLWLGLAGSLMAHIDHAIRIQKAAKAPPPKPTLPS